MNRPLNRAQQVVSVVAFGIGFVIAGIWFTSLCENSDLRWVAYAPLSRPATSPGFRWTLGWILLIWIGLLVLWCALSILILRTPDRA